MEKTEKIEPESSKSKKMWRKKTFTTKPLPSGQKVHVTMVRGLEKVARRMRVLVGHKHGIVWDAHGNLISNLIPIYKTVKKGGEPLLRVLVGHKEEADEKGQMVSKPIFRYITKNSELKDENGNVITDKEGVPVIKDGKPVLVGAKPVTTEIEVQGLRIVITFEDGTKYTVRSCCKPPDVFCVQMGKRKALRRLFMVDDGKDLATGKKVNLKEANLSGADRKALYYAVLSNNKSQSPPVKRKKKFTETPVPPGEEPAEETEVAAK